MSLLDGSGAFRILTGALNGLTERESAIASNLSNIDTPGYAPVTVDFESALQAEIANGTNGVVGSAAGSPSSAAVGMLRTNARHFSHGATAELHSEGASVTRSAETTRNDGNQVDLESEMTALSTTQIKYSAVSKLITSQLGMMRDAIGGR